MKNSSNIIDNLNIVKFSRLNAFILLLFIILSVFAQTYLFYKIDSLNIKKELISKTYEHLYSFEYNTEKLLTSYNLNKNKKDLEKIYGKYSKSFTSLEKTLDISDAVKNYNEIISLKFKDLVVFLSNSAFFNEKNLMNKPILVRLGEINRSEEENSHFISIKNFFQKVEHLKQYQMFLIEDLFELKEKVTKESNSEIESLNKLFIIIPILLFIVATVFSIVIDKAIREKEKTIVTTKELLENIISSIPIRVFWKDKNSTYLGTNKLFVQDAGLKSKDELIGKNDFELPWKDTEAKVYTDDDKFVMDSNEPKLNIIETQTRKDGSLAHLDTSKVPLRNEKGEVIGVLGIYEDITSKIEIEQKLKVQEAQIIQQNRLAQMGEMIAMIAHQWRQPLTIISTITGTLQIKNTNSKYDKEEYGKKLAKVMTQVKYLSHTIDDFRNFFKPGKLKSNISVKKLVDDTLKIIEPYLLKNNITIDVSYCCEKTLYTYSNEVKQVLLNIIRNSQDAFLENDIKDPKIKISAICSSESKCTLIIEDNAGGIDKETMQKIFDPYFSTKLDKNGTGLGLYMSKMIIEEHCEGKLLVESENNTTRFFIIV